MSSNSTGFLGKVVIESIKYFILLVLIVTKALSANCQAIKKDSVSLIHSKLGEPQFSNQGEQEDYWASQLFKREYRCEDYKRYKGKIVIQKDSYRYNDVVLMVYKYPTLKGVFEEGLFYPDIVSQSFKFKNPIKIKLQNNAATAGQTKDTSAAVKKLFYTMTRTDSLTITDLEELKFLETKPTQKRFRFWMFRKGFLNPIVYFFELTNENATPATDMSSFINGSKLTFFDEGWVSL